MGSLTRKDNWEQILYSEIEKAKTLKFEYGKNDCTIWSISVIKKISDFEWKPTWSNKREALRAQKSEPMQDQVSRALKQKYSSLPYAKRGDLIQRNEGIQASLGICIGSKVVFLKEGSGICYVDLKDCIYRWEI